MNILHLLWIVPASVCLGYLMACFFWGCGHDE